MVSERRHLGRNGKFCLISFSVKSDFQEQKKGAVYLKVYDRDLIHDVIFNVDVIIWFELWLRLECLENPPSLSLSSLNVNYSNPIRGSKLPWNPPDLRAYTNH